MKSEKLDEALAAAKHFEELARLRLDALVELKFKFDSLDCLEKELGRFLQQEQGHDLVRLAKAHCTCKEVLSDLEDEAAGDAGFVNYINYYAEGQNNGRTELAKELRKWLRAQRNKLTPDVPGDNAYLYGRDTAFSEVQNWLRRKK